MPKSNVSKPSFMAAADALKLCDKIKKNANALKASIQAAAMSAIFHANVHKNADVGIRLVDAMNGGIRKNSLAVYLCNHGNFEWDKEAKTVKFARNPDAICDEGKLFALLKDLDWSQAVKPEDPDAVLEAGKAMKALLNKIRKAVKHDKTIDVASDDPTAAKLVNIIMQVVKDGAEINLTETVVE